MQRDPHVGSGYLEIHAELPGKPPQFALDLNFPRWAHVRHNHLRQVASLLVETYQRFFEQVRGQVANLQGPGLVLVAKGDLGEQRGGGNVLPGLA